MVQFLSIIIFLVVTQTRDPDFFFIDESGFRGLLDPQEFRLELELEVDLPRSYFHGEFLEVSSWVPTRSSSSELLKSSMNPMLTVDPLDDFWSLSSSQPSASVNEKIVLALGLARESVMKREVVIVMLTCRLIVGASFFFYLKFCLITFDSRPRGFRVFKLYKDSCDYF
ncbi:GSCOCG00003804001-RA-CDS [Cotesia congregata]|nr:GSCOCG00003804001-RA-CDS [Cotesia congregata]